MGTDRTLRKKPLTRPVKRNGARSSRLKTHKARLVKLGMDAAAVNKLTSLAIRELLKYPVQTAKALEAAKAKQAAK